MPAVATRPVELAPPPPAEGDEALITICGDITEGDAIEVPATALTFDGFLAWYNSDDYPERGRIDFLDGKLFIDMAAERLGQHNFPKLEITRVLANLVRDEDRGIFYADGAGLFYRPTKTVVEPDAMFASWDTLTTDRLRLAAYTEQQRREGDALQMEGSPDWVLEVVSPGSTRKDTRDLVDHYHRMGVREYWLLDARRDKINLRVLIRDGDAWREDPPRDGWHRSDVFGRSFRLDRDRDRLGGWQYRLESRDE